MDPIKKPDRELGFVSLKMADHVPAQIGNRGTRYFVPGTQVFFLDLRFLHPVLADLPDSGGHRFPDPLHRHPFGHADKPDFGGVPAGRTGRPGDPFPHPLQVFGDHGFSIIAPVPH